MATLFAKQVKRKARLMAWTFHSYLHSLGRHDSLTVYFATEWWITPNICLRGGMKSISNFMQKQGSSPDNTVRELMKSANRWCRVMHYSRILLVAKKIEVNQGRDRSAEVFSN